MSFIRACAAELVAALLIAVLLLWARAPVVHATVQPIVLHGRLFATEEDAGNCVFHLDTVTITAPDQYLCDWLSGSNGYTLTLTLAPVD